MIKFLRFRKLKNNKNKKNNHKYEIILIKHGKFITRKFGKKIKGLKNIRTKDPTNIKILTRLGPESELLLKYTFLWGTLRCLQNLLKTKKVDHQ